MGNFSFDEDDDNQEPTFSLADFKKWLHKQGKGTPDLKTEDGSSGEVKEETKDEFKDKLRKRRSKKKED